MQKATRGYIRSGFAVLAVLILIIIGINAADSTGGEITLRVEDLPGRIRGHNIDYQVLTLEQEEAEDALEDMDQVLSKIAKLEEYIEKVDDQRTKDLLNVLLKPFQEQEVQSRKAVSQLGYEKDILAERLSLQTEELFYTYLSLERQQEMQQENLDFLKELFEMEKERRKQGMITLQELEKAVLQVEQAQLVMKSIEDQKKDVLNRIKDLIGYDLDIDLQLVDPGEPDEVALNRNQAIAYAITEGLVVRMQEQQYELKEGEKEKLKVEQARQQTRLQVEEAYRAAARAKDAYDLKERSLNLAKSNLERAEARFEAELVSGPALMEEYLNLIEAQQDYFQARLDYTLALTDFNLARQGISTSEVP